MFQDMTNHLFVVFIEDNNIMMTGYQQFPPLSTISLIKPDLYFFGSRVHNSGTVVIKDELTNIKANILVNSFAPIFDFHILELTKNQKSLLLSSGVFVFVFFYLEWKYQAVICRNINFHNNENVISKYNKDENIKFEKDLFIYFVVKRYNNLQLYPVCF